MRLTPFLIATLTALLVACGSASSEPNSTISPTPAATTARPAASPSLSPTPETTEEPSFPPLAPFSAELEAKLHEIRDRVSAIRGLPVHPTALEGIVTTEALAAYGQDQFASLNDEDAADAEAGEQMLKLLGLIPQDYSFEEYASEQANVIAGVYYPKADRLALVADSGDELSVSDELTIAHEYAHSLQDAKFDLDKFIDAWLESDAEDSGYTSYGETLSCLIEGDAEVTKRLYAEEVYGPDWQDIQRAESANDAPIEFDIPDFLLNSFLFNYNDCVAFVEQLYENGGWNAVNEAYVNPPGTTEQILDIQKYEDGEWADDPKPGETEGVPDGWSDVYGGQFGQYDIFNYLGSLTDDYMTGAVASFGWSSGWIRLMRNDEDGSKLAVEITLKWDVAEQRDFFLGGFDSVLAEYGVDPNSLQTLGLVQRWVSAPELGHHGGLRLDGAVPKITVFFASDQQTLDLFVPHQ